MKIKADGGAADGKAVHQNALDEILRGELGELGVECQHDGAIESRGGKQAQLCGFGGEPKQRLIRIEERARMRLEG